MPLMSQDSCMQDVLVNMSQKALGCVGLTGADGALTGVITDGDLRRHMSPDLLTKKASDIMTRNPKTIEASMLVADAAYFLSQNRISNIFVTRDEGEEHYPVGVLHLHACVQAGFA